MAVVCTPAALEAAAACLSCLTPKQQLIVQTYLLAVINNSATDKNGVSALLKASACFGCLSTKQLETVQAWLLCQIGVTVGA